MAPLKRRCFVTVGSIASFRDLLAEVLQPKFIEALKLAKFTSLELQCGPDYKWCKAQVEKLEDSMKENGISIRCFDYTDTMKAHMLKCRGVAGKQGAGCIISHAGIHSAPNCLLLLPC